MSLFVEEFAEKIVKKYIKKGVWLDCSLADFYIYLEYYDEGGYSSIHKIMDRINGKHLILKRSSKKDFLPCSKESMLAFGHLDQSVPCLKDSMLAFGHLAQSVPCSKVALHIFDPSLRNEVVPQISKEAEFMVKVHQKLGGIKMYDYYDDDDYYILIMENGGRSLENITCSHKKKILDLIRYDAYQSNFFYQSYLNNITQYMVKLYHKIKEIHDLGIHHNDLKPENILIKGDDMFIIDFGVSKAIESKQHTVFQTYKGTLQYIPYEYVAYGSYKPWNHTIWCFGVMLHFLTLMKYPFSKETDVINYKLNHEKINKLPPSFSALILDCLHKQPSKRPRHNLLERLETLRSYQDDQ
jgi:serine/threonine protein kinase